MVEITLALGEAEAEILVGVLQYAVDTNRNVAALRHATPTERAMWLLEAQIAERVMRKVQTTLDELAAAEAVREETK